LADRGWLDDDGTIWREIREKHAPIMKRWRRLRLVPNSDSPEAA
jgi:hypothetical protein